MWLVINIKYSDIVSDETQLPGLDVCTFKWTLFVVFIRLLEMDRSFQHGSASVPHSSHCLASLSLQVSYRIFVCLYFLFLFITNYTCIQWKAQAGFSVLFEGTRWFTAAVAAGHFTNRKCLHRCYLQPSRMWLKCSGTCPGWRCPICWISSCILALRGPVSPETYGQ